jgi:hypothetical protein
MALLKERGEPADVDVRAARPAQERTSSAKPDLRPPA